MVIGKNRCPCCHGVVRTKKHGNYTLKISEPRPPAKYMYVKKIKDFLICGRNINKVGIRKNNHKYCSPACMWLAQRVRSRGSKYTMIKVAIEDLPRLFRRNRGLTIGR